MLYRLAKRKEGGVLKSRKRRMKSLHTSTRMLIFMPRMGMYTGNATVMITITYLHTCVHEHVCVWY